MKNISENKIIIATGGTGGHVIPAYSLAKDLIKKNFDVKIITDSRGLVFLEKFKDVIPVQALIDLFGCHGRRQLITISAWGRASSKSFSAGKVGSVVEHIAISVFLT